MSSRLSPPLAYRLGLVAQTLTDAAPRGLTLARLELRTQLEERALSDVLRVCLDQGHARRRGERFYAT